MVVYIDILLVVNLYINYFLIRGTALLLRRNITVKRRILASFIGALMALIILLPALPFWLTSIIKAISSIVIVLAAFGKAKPPQMIINILCFLIISFIYAGLMLALWLFVAPFGMFFRNGTAYFDIPMIAVAIFTVLAYTVVRFVHYVMTRKNLSITVKEIKIINGGNEVQLEGIADTGNSLCDPFSGKPAIICNIAYISAIVPHNITAYFNNDMADIDSLRLVPYSTIMGESLIPVFFADKIIIGDKPVDAVVGVCNKPIGTQCLFNPELITL